MTGAEIGGVSLGTAILLLGAAVGAVVALTFFVAIVKGFLYICRPNEILIFSGRKHTLPNGQSTGYKVVRRGWAVRIPILETVNRMDMRLFMVEVTVTSTMKSRMSMRFTVSRMGMRTAQPRRTTL